MREFDIEKAKAGYPVQTRDERNVRILAFDRREQDNSYPIIGLIDNEDNEDPEMWDKSGSTYGDIKDQCDLVMKLTKKKGWINLFKGSGKIRLSPMVHSTKEIALSQIDTYSESYIDTIKIEWEE